MKRVRINAGKVGLVFRKGDYQRVITQGTHWLFLNQIVLISSNFGESQSSGISSFALFQNVLSNLSKLDNRTYLHVNMAY